MPENTLQQPLSEAQADSILDTIAASFVNPIRSPIR